MFDTCRFGIVAPVVFTVADLEKRGGAFSLRRGRTVGNLEAVEALKGSSADEAAREAGRARGSEKEWKCKGIKGMKVMEGIK